MTFKLDFLRDFIGLFIPKKCPACGMSLNKQEIAICATCLASLPKTKFKDIENNPVSQSFWGRIELEFAFAAYFFEKESTLQSLIHKIKYHNAKELGFELGKQMAFELKDSINYEKIDVICPVPLHPNKEKKRGYNQSEVIGRGFAEGLNIPFEKDILKRVEYTKTQTKKNRVDRWENVKNAFAIQNSTGLSNKHIVVIDDVLTTGATLEACCSNLTAIDGTKVSIAALAFSGGGF